MTCFFLPTNAIWDVRAELLADRLRIVIVLIAAEIVVALINIAVDLYVGVD